MLQMSLLKSFGFAAVLLGLMPLPGHTQSLPKVWNTKSCAVVLTYDDAIDVDLDNALPALDSCHLRGTFYLIGASPVVAKRVEEWRVAARHGHELGNHTLFHPCDGRLPNRSWVNPDHDLSTYTVGRAVDEIRVNNTLLHAIDGKTARTFGYPCGDLQIGGVSFYDQVKGEFVAARGAGQGLTTPAQAKAGLINCQAIEHETGEAMIDLVKQAQKNRALLVFVFHGVGGGHAINIGLAAHRQLLRYLQAHSDDIWVAPLVEVATYMQAGKPGGSVLTK